MDRVGRALERKSDVDKGSDGLDMGRLLGVVDEVALAGLIFGVPLKDVELQSQVSAQGIDDESMQTWTVPGGLGIVLHWAKIDGQAELVEGIWRSEQILVGSPFQ